MKIFNPQQIKELDQYTIQEQSISSVDLMERAAHKIVDHITLNYAITQNFTVYCGLGNNGGDGLAVSRLLLKKGYNVTVYVVKYSANTSLDFDENIERLKKITTLRTIISEKHIPPIPNNTVIIDAILGVGINRPLDGLCKVLVDAINTAPNFKIAIDIPTGLFCELENYSTEHTLLNANTTLTFETPKLPYLMPSMAKHIGNWKVLSINLSSHYKHNIATEYEYTTLADIQKINIHRAKFSHKGTFGHAEIIGGAYGKIGAIVLATKACLKAGVGLVTAYTPNCGMQILQTTVPEAMWTGNQPCDFYLEGNYINTSKTIGMGPGLGVHPKTQAFLHLVIKATSTPMVLDADAINILAKNKEWLKDLPKNSILTPHPKEFERLVGSFNNDFEKLEKLKEFTETYNCIIVLKGANTAICSPNGQIYFNSTGNPGMATAGSGDVLTGIITSLLAQKHKPIEAAILGVYIHGFAGDLASTKTGQISLTASDLIKNIGKAYLKIKQVS
ncbi:NAD(P)H-hydrate epimerase [Wenyingzhuangia heitensis]|uniref:Bifunctional NAD(P)H-hydrate repair enzyme n=1 Tax=Wenyingzhuangia heitensis TaxID=1487859 RepID=A0ABX0UA42_9FLAO|nr:NAD(P)H-hydrate dehydratase [Wenyingzhuangia heitensis]NIJ45672.1 NAD(P)H-hydrate epimerase [Wenyingzhuangia heitensis]